VRHQDPSFGHERLMTAPGHDYLTRCELGFEECFAIGDPSLAAFERFSSQPASLP
jgi:hypothetical protein